MGTPSAVHRINYIFPKQEITHNQTIFHSPPFEISNFYQNPSNQLAKKATWEQKIKRSLPPTRLEVEIIKL